MTALSAPDLDVVCIGILVADTVVRAVDELPPRGSLAEVEEVSLHAGGCALNTATALAGLGLNVAVIGKVGNDVFGDFLLDVLDRRQIDRSGVFPDDTVATSASVVAVDRHGERTFLHLPGANGTLTGRELDWDAVLRGRALHVGGALVMPAFDGLAMAELLSCAQSLGRFTSLAPVWDPHGTWHRILPCLSNLDLFCSNFGEASAISGVQGVVEAARWLRNQGVANVALTLGPEGCYVANHTFEGHIEAFPVTPVDGTGAGDAFVAGTLYGLIAGWPLESAARFGNAAGALATTVVGAPDTVVTLPNLLSLAQMELLT